MPPASRLEPQRLGRQHALVRAFHQALRGHAGREASVLILLETPKLIGDALRSRMKLETVLFTPAGWRQHGAPLGAQLSKHTTVGLVEESVLRSCVEVETPAGVAALAHPPQARLEEIWASPAAGPALVVAAAGLQDPGNLGTLARAAEAFGAQALVTLQGSVSCWRPKTIRAGAGALFRLPVLDGVEPGLWLDFCRRREAALLAAVPRRGRPPESLPWSGRICLLIGGEGAGLPRALERAATAVSLPMRPQAESLNAAVAGAVLLYLAWRGRPPDPAPPEGGAIMA